MYGLDDLAMGELLFYKSDLKPSEKCLAQSLYKSKLRSQHDIMSRSLFYLMRIAAAQGNYGKLQDLLKDLRAMLEISDYGSRYLTSDIISSWHFSAIGQPQLVADWMKDSFTHDFANATMIFGNIVKAKYFYFAKRHYELLSFIESGEIPGLVLIGELELKTLEAACHYQLKNKGAAFKALREAYALAESNGLAMPFIELGKDMRTLTAAAMRDAECGIPREWLEMVNRKAATYAKRLAFISSEYKKANNLNENPQLSPKEAEILGDLYHGLSRSEIAANRDLSINTVKLVVNAIYSKLGADNIVDVIRAAMDMHLIK
jgi:LuxR family maltose regulon positive regulatory protein